MLTYLNLGKRVNPLKVLQFNGRYLIASILLLLVLVGIALFLHDQIIRPFIGDVLVIVWMFLCLKSFINITTKKMTLFVLLFAYALEIGQFFNLVDILGLQHIKIARIIIGSTFDWFDFLAYTLGGGCILMMDWCRIKYFSNN